MLIERLTLQLSNIPKTAIVKDLLHFLQTQLGKDSIFALEINTERKNWKSRGFGRVQFTSLEFKQKAQSLSLQNKLVFNSHNLKLSETYDDIIARPTKAEFRVEKGNLSVGFMRDEKSFCLLESWEVRGWIMPERRRVEFWVLVDEVYRYKMEVRFEDVLEVNGYCYDDENKVNALLLKLKSAPKIYERVSGPDIASRFRTDRYHFCKEDFDFAWVRTTDFSAAKSIGQATSFFWEIEEGLLASDVSTSFPYYKEDTNDLDLEEGKEFCSASELVPLINCGSDIEIAHEVLYQLNSLIHTQKISLAAVDADLIGILNGLSIETAIMILQKLHKLQSICYNPVAFVKLQLHVRGRNLKRPHSSLNGSLTNNNLMQCQRVLVTPTKIYCMGPELETANYVVKNFAEYASDFIRVTFVEEDWSRIPPNAISSSIRLGMFAKPYRTKIYHRMLSVLRDGIQIGFKRYQFLAFSASQLRSSSVWMFASNDKVKAQDIRKWMGCFDKIRNISKCAARMGQLFSSSRETFEVPLEDVEIIPDIEVTADGFDYCFSDGIGKISLPFAREVAQKCGLNHTPSAFQIRYGGYKGVIAVDNNSVHKLSLRKSMCKFDSDKRMLNVTKCTESMPCYLNREIVILLSTLGVKDEIFEALELAQLRRLGQMLSNRDAALDVLENLTWAGSKHILVKMLLQGYEPNVQPYLSMMLQAYHENLLLDIKSRCRVLVPKGRVLVGCLDEAAILDYGQVYIRVTMTKSEMQTKDQSFFRKVDEKTSIVTGRVVVTKNPCLHPGDVRVLEAVYVAELEEKGYVDCILFPQKGARPHPNECSGGDLDGDQFFISWDEGLIPCNTDAPMDYLGSRPRITDHDVSIEEIQKFFVDYMINDTLGAISTAHLVHADSEPEKARSAKCLELANLHSMAVDFAKTGAPAEMPRALTPRQYPDFMERVEKPMYISSGVLGKLYRAALDPTTEGKSKFIWSVEVAEATYDRDLEVNGFDDFIKLASTHRDMYKDKMNALMIYFEAKDEDEILTGNLRNRATYLQRDNRKYGDMKDRILAAIKNLHNEVKEWFDNSCKSEERQRLASAWYHVTYHPSYFQESVNCLSFPWIVGDVLLSIKSVNSQMNKEETC